MGRNHSRETIDPKLLAPHGVYAHCAWDAHTLRRMVLSKKVSPFFPPLENQVERTDECPICMMFYFGGLNRSACCGQPICSECFFQVKKPSKKSSGGGGAAANQSLCPFCNTKPYHVIYRGPKTEDELLKERIEEQKVIELRLQMQREQAELQNQKKQREISDNQAEDRNGANSLNSSQNDDYNDNDRTTRFLLSNQQRIITEQEEEQTNNSSSHAQEATTTPITRTTSRLAQEARELLNDFVPSDVADQITTNEDIDTLMLERAIALSLREQEEEVNRQQEILDQLQLAHRETTVTRRRSHDVVDRQAQHGEQEEMRETRNHENEVSGSTRDVQLNDTSSDQQQHFSIHLEEDGEEDVGVSLDNVFIRAFTPRVTNNGDEGDDLEITFMDPNPISSDECEDVLTRTAVHNMSQEDLTALEEEALYQKELSLSGMNEEEEEELSDGI